MLLYDTNLSRRALLKSMAAIPLATGLVGCKKTGQETKSLRFFATGTLDIGKENWNLLERSLDIRVAFTDNGNDVGPVLARMINGTAATEFDLGGVQGGAEREMFDADVILPWDTSRLKNWDTVWDWMKGIPYLTHRQQQVSLPIVANADSMIYLEKETGTVDSYAAIFDPKFRGRTSMEDAWINSVIFTAMFMKENNIDGMARIANPGDLEEEELRTVMEFLKRHKRDGQFLKFWRGWEEGVHLIANRQVVVMSGWEPIVHAARAKGATDAAYAVPKEGYEGWSNNLVIHRGAKDRGLVDTAHQFADWLLGGEYGCVLGELRGYMVPNDKCLDITREKPLGYWDEVNSRKAELVFESANRLNSHVKNKFLARKGQVYWQNTRPRNYQLYDRLWNELRAL